MDQVELKAEKAEGERANGGGSALSNAEDRIEIPSVLRSVAEAETKENLGVSQQKAGTKKSAVKQFRAQASLETLTKAAAPVKKSTNENNPSKEESACEANVSGS